MKLTAVFSYPSRRRAAVMAVHVLMAAVVNRWLADLAVWIGVGSMIKWLGMSVRTASAASRLHLQSDIGLSNDISSATPADWFL